MKRAVIGAIAAVATVGVASVGFAQKTVSPKKVDAAQKAKPVKKKGTKVITAEKLAAANNIAKIRQTGASTESVKGPLDGTACATDNPSTSTSTHTGVGVPCTVGGESATCTCDLACTNICANKEFSSDCNVSNCTVKVPGDSGGTSQAQVQTAF